MNTIDQYAVFGSPINHSKSPRIHRLFAKQTHQNLDYVAQEVNAKNFVTAVTEFFAQGSKGVNCTVPLKELAYRFATQKTERAKAAKAVNTLALQSDGSILGDNTDGMGLVTDLTVNHGVVLKDKRVLILGAGGATRGILAPLLDQKLERLIVANRTEDKALRLAIEFNHSFDGCGLDDLHEQPFDLILNATSASLSNELPPLPENLLAENGVCYDLAYGNTPTAFVRWGKLQNASKSVDGLGMLVEQAAEAFALWRGVRPDTKAVIDLLNTERSA
ncbi:MAG: shikimate dehydrogenase [Methylococcales bacterium]|nr:shikimate dehydrogenase [Methylococcales bacterium]